MFQSKLDHLIYQDKMFQLEMFFQKSLLLMGTNPHLNMHSFTSMPFARSMCKSFTLPKKNTPSGKDMAGHQGFEIHQCHGESRF